MHFFSLIASSSSLLGPDLETKNVGTKKSMVNNDVNSLILGEKKN